MTDSDDSVRHDGEGGNYEIITLSLAWRFLTGGCNAALPDKSIGRKGAEKPDRVSPVGWHKQIGLNCTGCGPSTASRATAVFMARQRSRRRKPLYLRNPPSHAAMAAEAKRSEAAGLLFPRCCARLARARDGARSLRPVLCIARGIAYRLRTRRLEIATWEPGSSAQHGTGLAATAGDGRHPGRSFRSSRSAGKPRTGRREAGRRQTCMTEE